MTLQYVHHTKKSKFHMEYAILTKSQLLSMQGKPEVNYLVNTGFYLIKPNVLKYLSYNQKTDMNEFITKLKKLKKIGVYPVPGNSWLDMGEWNEYQKTINLLK